MPASGSCSNSVRALIARSLSRNSTVISKALVASSLSTLVYVMKEPVAALAQSLTTFQFRSIQVRNRGKRREREMSWK
jgi:hypothetical protein